MPAFGRPRPQRLTPRRGRVWLHAWLRPRPGS
jgi:hypothetical protein